MATIPRSASELWGHLEKVRRCEPSSDAQRFWKVVYGRLCTYGAKPNLSGYASIHDGQTYSLDELWKFIDGEKRMPQVAADRATVLGLIRRSYVPARDARRE
jgi:hypothetical protein